MLRYISISTGLVRPADFEEKEDQAMPHTIAVAGKGGVGKTTFTISKIVARREASVAYRRLPVTGPVRERAHEPP